MDFNHPETVVYANTDKPYEEWRPAYVIVGYYEGITFRTSWVPWGAYQRAKPEAKALVETYIREAGRGVLTINVARWKKEICEAIVEIIRSHTHGRIQATVEYPPIEENHCRVFTLVRS